MKFPLSPIHFGLCSEKPSSSICIQFLFLKKGLNRFWSWLFYIRSLASQCWWETWRDYITTEQQQAHNNEGFQQISNQGKLRSSYTHFTMPVILCPDYVTCTPRHTIINQLLLVHLPVTVNLSRNTLLDFSVQ